MSKLKSIEEMTGKTVTSVTIETFYRPDYKLLTIKFTDETEIHLKFEIDGYYHSGAQGSGVIRWPELSIVK